MKILVVGSGGREHALCWKIAQSDKVNKLYCAPGNGGIADIAECVDIDSDDIEGILRFAIDNKIDITVVGPEAPLTAGIIDIFNAHGLKAFGPDKVSAQLEASKGFAKAVMQRFGIKTAAFKIFDNLVQAKAYIDSSPLPLVIKANGLCAGKGVIIAETKANALSAADTIMRGKSFGAAGDRIIVEEYLQGEEASVILVTDGKDYILFPTSQDHKRIFDNNQGPNTGGMGAYSPALIVTDALISRIEKDIICPLIEGLSREGTPYKGALYIGLMIVNGDPYVLEFNVRFGDPETQAILPRLETDLVDILQQTIDGGIHRIKPVFDRRPCVCVVLASGGYPGDYKRGFPITGLDRACLLEDVIIFHAGTRLTGPEKPIPHILTNGGRVLGVTAIAKDMQGAIDKAYKAIGLVGFEGMQYRRDIGQKARGY
jgi:phosphoribosylamine---glycine ligase